MPRVTRPRICSEVSASGRLPPSCPYQRGSSLAPWQFTKWVRHASAARAHRDPWGGDRYRSSARPSSRRSVAADEPDHAAALTAKAARYAAAGRDLPAAAVRRSRTSPAGSRAPATSGRRPTTRVGPTNRRGSFDAGASHA